MKPRIIVCGLSSTGYKIFCLLRQQGASVLGINQHTIPDERDEVIIGDLRASSTLLAAGIARADTLVLAGDDEVLNLAILTQARVLNPSIRIINRLFNTSLGASLDRTLPDHVTMSVAALAAPVFAFAALGNQAIGQLRLFNQTWPIHEEVMNDNHPWLGRKLSELWDDRSRMLIYYLPSKGSLDLISAVICGQELQVGDRLIVGTKPNIHTHHKSLLQKLLKFLMNLRQFQQHGNPLLLVTLTLLATILVATITYICFEVNIPLVDALYFSVGMITGGGGDESIIKQASVGLKLFTIVMMLVGAAIVGLCYALLNEFVLGTHLRQFLDAARVPQRNHYIVCGLGGIGVQIVHQLHTNGHEVVVIERDANNRFLSTVRCLGVPVILEDASLSATLKSANVCTCDALLVVTSNDAVNLEIALSAKGISPNLRVVVRIQDPQFARTVQQVFAFEAVLSPTELAAPSFAAAALGGRILGNGMTGDSLWIALATMITPAHPFCGKRVKEAAMNADFVPLYIENHCQTLHGWDILETCLSAGDVLYLTMPATRLDQLWRVTPSFGLIVS